MGLLHPYIIQKIILFLKIMVYKKNLQLEVFLLLMQQTRFITLPVTVFFSGTLVM